jgi:hypothetical protein
MVVKHAISKIVNGKRTRPRIYRIWLSMRERCSNPKKRGYQNYGGRGIRVCDRWNSFAAFAEDMENPPDGFSIDRIDVNGNYCPENCRWMSHKEQCRNTRYNNRLEIDGVTKTIVEWSEQDGARNQKTIYDRMSKGWSTRDAVFAPVLRRRMR